MDMFYNINLCILFRVNPLVLLFLWLFLGNATEHDSVQLFSNGSIYIDEEKKAENLLVQLGLNKPNFRL